MAKNDYIEEVKDNIMVDRKKLTDLYDSIKKLTLVQGQEDILALAAVSENLVKIADSLTKQNSQLVDLAKLKQKINEAKKPAPGDGAGFGDGDADEIFNEINAQSKKGA